MMDRIEDIDRRQRLLQLENRIVDVKSEINIDALLVSITQFADKS